LSNFFDQLDKTCRDHDLDDPETFIREKFLTYAKERELEFSGFYFSVFKSQNNDYARYRKLTERSLPGDRKTSRGERQKNTCTQFWQRLR